MSLEDNKHVTTTIQVIGEACQDVVTFHNINNLQRTDLDGDEGERPQGGWKKGTIRKGGFGWAPGSNVPSPPGDQEVLNLGGCYVDRPYQQSFVITNHSSSQVFKFEWPPVRNLCFSPQVLLI